VLERGTRKKKKRREAYIQTDKHTAEKQRNRQTERQTEIQTEINTDRKTDRGRREREREKRERNYIPERRRIQTIPQKSIHIYYTHAREVDPVDNIVVYHGATTSNSL